MNESEIKSFYRSRLITFAELPNFIHSNSDIIVAMCANEPQGAMEVLHKAAPRVKNVNVFSCLTLKPYEFFMNSKMKGHFYLNSWFHGAPARKAVEDKIGTVSFVPNMLHRAVLDRLSVRQPDLFIGSCTPPNKLGYVSLSCSLVYEKHALREAKKVILEVNKNLPWVNGDTQVHINEVDHFIENHTELPHLMPKPPSDLEVKIGHHISSLIEDGSTIQLGIGAIPNAVALSLKDKKNLGVHTEMMVDSMMELHKSGVITNKEKTYIPGKMVATFAMGSPELYRWLNKHPDIEFHQGEWVNDPSVVRKNNKMISINTGLMVDLSGQIASEAIGLSQYSGTGGQSDTAVGAKEGYDGRGKSIIALKATAKNDSLSTIVLTFPEGTPTTLHRSHSDFVVTEYGVASLRGRSIRERACELISISHPKFREELTSRARNHGLID